MRPDNTHHLLTAAKQRHELTRAKAIRALHELDRTGTAVTFETVARTAGVSRSWLYTQPDIRTEIRRLRDTTRRAPSPPANVPPTPPCCAACRQPTNATTHSPRRTGGCVVNSPRHSGNGAPQPPPTPAARRPSAVRSIALR
jgi:hypothetical protein